MKRVLISGLLLASSMALANGSSDEYLGASLDVVQHGLKLGDSSYPSKGEDKRDTGYSVKAGYYSSPNLAWELEYADSGKGTRNYDRPGSPDDKLEAHVKSFSISAKAQLPINDKLSVYGKAGVARLAGRQTFRSAVLPEEVLVQKANKLVPVFGIGAELKLDDNLRAFLELSQTGKLKYDANGTLPADTQQLRRLGAGFSYHY